MNFSLINNHQNSKKIYHLRIICLIITIIILINIFVLAFDQFFGDGDGKIITYGISSWVNTISKLIIFLLAFCITLYYKKYIFFLIYVCICIIIIDFFILGPILGEKTYSSYIGGDYYYPVPYFGFKGRPNWGKHNAQGFKGEETHFAKIDDFVIAFFGGSTGYHGNPPIAQAIEQNLKDANFNNGKIFVGNYSVVSSNHNQHLHMIIELLMMEGIDLIIFYGGYNETIQTAWYDPRPGYPYNFFIIHNTSHMKKFIIENSILLSTLFNKYGKHYILSNKSELGETPFSDDWNKKIIKNYFQTLEKANLISKSIINQPMGQTTFISIYQPFQVPKEFQKSHELIRSKIDSISYIYDLSDKYQHFDNPYQDIVHVNQEARMYMAKLISEIILSL